MSAGPVGVSRRRIEFRSLAILVAVAVGVSAAGFFLLYRRTLEARTVQLAEMARAQARLFEASAKFDAFFHSGEIAGAARSATLTKIKEAHRRYRGFGKTGEMTLAAREGPEIVFLLPTRKLDFKVPRPVSFDAERGGPMQLALQGKSGVTVALDHSGSRVLAAYEWLPFLQMGLVCKIDMAEIRAPFWTAAGWTGGVALLLILAGAALNSRMVSPLVSQVLEDAEIIREREARYRGLVANIPGAVFRAEADERHTMRELSERVVEITGRTADALLDDRELGFIEIVLSEDADVLRRGVAGYLEPGRTFRLEYRIRRADGEVRWVSEYGTLVEVAGGRRFLEGVMLDVTERKEAEAALAELPRKLSKYLSPQVYRSIFEGDQDVRVGTSRKKLTIFFSDIVDFTAKSDSLDPEDLSFLVNTYLDRMANVTVEHGGTLDKFIGDGVLVFFGDPESRGIEQDARACVRMALAMREAVQEVNQQILRQGIHAPLEVRMGISTGFCTVGNFGSESRMDYTVLGRYVNLAARLESAAAPNEILLSREAWLLVRDAFETEPLEPIEVKGFDQPLDVFRIAG